MTGEPVLYVDTSVIKEERVEDVKQAIKEVVHFVEQHEPHLVSYAVYLDEEARRMTVIHLHGDSESLAFHLEIAGARFAPFADLLELLSIDVFGTVSAQVMDRLRQKAELLGGAPVRAHPFHAGFVRTCE